MARLQTAWSRRLQQEAALVATQESEVLTKEFRENVLPSLEWTQARDLFLAGSTAAAGKMLQIIQQNQANKNTPQWIKELRNLLTYGQETAPGEPVKKSGPAAASGTRPPEVADPLAPAPPAARPRGPAPALPPNRTR